MWKKISEKINSLLFPAFCFGCRQEGTYLCPDCQALLDISSVHNPYTGEYLDCLYFSVDYKNYLIKKIIKSFKYQPFIKDLSKTLADLIISHFQLIDNKPDFFLNPENDISNKNYILVPVPLDKQKLKKRGFNQAELLAKDMGSYLNFPIKKGCLIKIKKTFPQVGLDNRSRKDNLKSAFAIKEKEAVKNKNILLIDDVFTSGATLNECAKVLKRAGAKQVIGITVARG